MNADRIDIFHITNGDHIARTVAHHFVFDFLPSCDASLHQDLSHTGQTKAVFQDLRTFFRVLCDTAAGTAQCVSRTKDYGITDLFRDFQTVFDILHDIGGSHRLADLLHSLLKHLAVFRLFDGKSRGSDQTHVVILKKSGVL